MEFDSIKLKLNGVIFFELSENKKNVYARTNNL